MTAVVAAIAASVAGGLAVERRLGDRSMDVARAVLTFMFWVLMPFVTFFSLARLHITTGVLGHASHARSIALRRGAGGPTNPPWHWSCTRLRVGACVLLSWVLGSADSN